MLAIFFIYFIGNAFYKLAEQFKKNKWVFAIIGVATYYLSGVVILGGGIVLGMLISYDFAYEESEWYGWNLLGIPIGLASCYGLYKLLQYQWQKPERKISEEVIDGDLIS